MSAATPRSGRALAAAVLLACAGAAPAGAGSLTWHAVPPEGYVDAGRTEGEREGHVAEVERLLRRLAADRLPADAHLEVELLDLDLAGHLEPTLRGERRIVRSAVDAPAITLRWRLERPGAAPVVGSERLHELDPPRLAGDAALDDPLRHERRLLERWFAQRLAAPAP